MIGANTLLRILGKPGVKFFDRLGFLPPRWFLKQALDALSLNDLPLVIRYLRRIRRRDTHRWELIRQQAVFRCRILRENHERALRRLEKFRQSEYLKNLDRDDLSQVFDLHRLAIQALSAYEETLQRLSSDETTKQNLSSSDGSLTTLRDSEMVKG